MKVACLGKNSEDIFVGKYTVREKNFRAYSTYPTQQTPYAPPHSPPPHQLYTIVQFKQHHQPYCTYTHPNPTRSKGLFSTPVVFAAFPLTFVKTFRLA